MAEDQGDSMVNGTRNNETASNDENVPGGATIDGDSGCGRDDECRKTGEAESVVVSSVDHPSAEGCSSSTKELEEATVNENDRILESISTTSTEGTKCTGESGKDCGTGRSQDDSAEPVPEDEKVSSEETSSKEDKTSQESVKTETSLTSAPQESEANIDAIISEEERKLNKILKYVRKEDAGSKDLVGSIGERGKDDDDDVEEEEEEEEEEKVVDDDNERNDDDTRAMHIDEMTSSDAKEEENDDEAFVDTALAQEDQKVVEAEEEEEEEESAEDSRPSEDRRIELTEVGIVGPPTAVSELINEEELRTESALPTEEKLQDHIAEWVQNTARAEDLTIGAEETRSRRSGEEVKGRRRRRRRRRTTTKKTRKSSVGPSIPAPIRKSQRIVSNIIKKSIKCSRRFWSSKQEEGGSGGKQTSSTIWCEAATSSGSTEISEQRRRNEVRISSFEGRKEKEEEEEEEEKKRKIVVRGKRRTRKMPQCAVATCRNSHRRTRGRRIRYHRFPQIPEVRSRWVRACGRVPLANGDIPFNIQTARICSLHFTNDSYEKDMEHLVLGLPVRSRLRRGAVPTVGVPVNVQPVTRMLVEDAKRSLLKVAHAKILTGQKMANGVAGESRQQEQEKCIVVQKQQRQRSKNANEQKMAGIDVLLALGLKPASRLNKMHAMDGTGGNGKRPETDKRESHGVAVARGSSRVPLSQQNGAALPEETATTTDQIRPPATAIKKEPISESEPDSADVVPDLPRTATRTIVKSDGTDGRKRRSSDEPLTSNGGNAASKRACLEQREQFITSLVGNDKASAEELAARADQLRAEVQALDELARAKEMEWNEILSMRKLKEEAYLRLERRRQVVGFMEGNGELIESLPPASLTLGSNDWDGGSTTAKDKIGYGSLQDGSPPSRKDKIVKLQSHRQSSPPKLGESGRKQTVDSQNLENRQIGEGRQGPIVDVRSIIADYRLRHPETVPRRGRRMRNSVNVGLGAGGAMVETGHTVDSRPSSTDSCKSNPNAADPNSSMSFKDVLVQFAKLSQQQGEPVKTPQNYPDVTLHPVAPSPSPQNTAPQQTGSLLHGILTKSQSPRPTTFSPTLARLLTAPERERNTTVTAASAPQQNATTQHLLQAYQGSNPVSISDLLSSSKARTEITITPVVNTSVQSHSNSLVHVDDVEEETTVIEERGTRVSSGVRDNREEKDNPPRCQGCHERAAQFVCAGCGNQWYCSRECQVSAWDDHSEVCSG